MEEQEAKELECDLVCIDEKMRWEWLEEVQNFCGIGFVLCLASIFIIGMLKNAAYIDPYLHDILTEVCWFSFCLFFCLTLLIGIFVHGKD